MCQVHKLKTEKKLCIFHTKFKFSDSSRCLYTKRVDCNLLTINCMLTKTVIVVVLNNIESAFYKTYTFTLYTTIFNFSKKRTDFFERTLSTFIG